MNPPLLTSEQRRAAQDRAIAARRVRSEVRTALKSRSTSLREVMDRASTDDAIGRMKVVDVLEALPAIGPTKADRIMKRLGIAMSRRLRGLGEHQRERLLAEFA